MPRWLRRMFWPHKEHKYTIKVFDEDGRVIEPFTFFMNEGIIQRNTKHGTIIFSTEDHDALGPNVRIEDNSGKYFVSDYGKTYDENRHLDDIQQKTI